MTAAGGNQFNDPSATKRHVVKRPISGDFNAPGSKLPASDLRVWFVGWLEGRSVFGSTTTAVCGDPGQPRRRRGGVPRRDSPWVITSSGRTDECCVQDDSVHVMPVGPCCRPAAR